MVDAITIQHSMFNDHMLKLMSSSYSHRHFTFTHNHAQHVAALGAVTPQIVYSNGSETLCFSMLSSEYQSVSFWSAGLTFSMTLTCDLKSL